MLGPFNTILYVVVTLNHKIISLLLCNCSFAIVMYHNVNIWYANPKRVVTTIWEPLIKSFSIPFAPLCFSLLWQFCKSSNFILLGKLSVLAKYSALFPFLLCYRQYNWVVFPMFQMNSFLLTVASWLWYALQTGKWEMWRIQYLILAS